MHRDNEEKNQTRASSHKTITAAAEELHNWLALVGPSQISQIKNVFHFGMNFTLIFPRCGAQKLLLQSKAALCCHPVSYTLNISGNLA